MVGPDVPLVILRGLVCKTLFPPQHLSPGFSALILALAPGTRVPFLYRLSRRIPQAAPTLCKLQTQPGESNLPLLPRPRLTALRCCLRYKWSVRWFSCNNLIVVILASEVVELGFGSSFSQGVFKSTCPFPGCRQPLSPPYWSCAMVWRRIRRAGEEKQVGAWLWPTGWDLPWREVGSRHLAAFPRLLTTRFTWKNITGIKIKTDPGGRVQTQHLSPQGEVATTMAWQRVLFSCHPTHILFLQPRL